MKPTVTELKVLFSLALFEIEGKTFENVEAIKTHLAERTGIEVNLIDENGLSKMDGEFVISNDNQEFEEFSIWYVNNNGLLITETTSNHFNKPLNPPTKSTSGWMDLTLMQILEEYKDGDEEALDGDSVDELCKIIKAKINLQEGNITDEEYNQLLG